MSAFLWYACFLCVWNLILCNGAKIELWNIGRAYETEKDDYTFIFDGGGWRNGENFLARFPPGIVPFGNIFNTTVVQFSYTDGASYLTAYVYDTIHKIMEVCIQEKCRIICISAGCVGALNQMDTIFIDTKLIMVSGVWLDGAEMRFSITFDAYMKDIGYKTSRLCQGSDCLSTEYLMRKFRRDIFILQSMHDEACEKFGVYDLSFFVPDYAGIFYRKGSHHTPLRALQNGYATTSIRYWDETGDAVEEWVSEGDIVDIMNKDPTTTIIMMAGMGLLSFAFLCIIWKCSKQYEEYDSLDENGEVNKPIKEDKEQTEVANVC